MNSPGVRFRRLVPGAVAPERHTPGSAGFDLAASADSIVPARSFVAVPTGIALEMPDGVEAQVRPRSGLALKHGIGILNAPGTIDSDYRGEVRVLLFNLSDRDFPVRRGDRIAQLVFARALAVEFNESDRLSDTDRGEGGFGHTG